MVQANNPTTCKQREEDQEFKVRMACILLLCHKTKHLNWKPEQKKIRLFACVSDSVSCCFVLGWVFPLWESSESLFPIRPYTAGGVGWGGRVGEEKILRTFGDKGMGLGDVWASGHKMRCLQMARGTSAWATPPAFLCQQPRHCFLSILRPRRA